VIVEQRESLCASVQRGVSRSASYLYARTDDSNAVCAAVHYPARVYRGFRAKVTLGPPGTGKTTKAVETVLDLLQRGIPALQIGFVTFTRAAQREVVARLHDHAGLLPDALPWFRTIHSAAFRVLRLARGVLMDDGQWRQFGERVGYRFTPTRAFDLDEGPPVMPARTAADELRFFHFWARNQMLAVPEAISRTPLTHLRPRDIDVFNRHLRDYKADEHLLDFCDILERALRGAARPPVDVAFIDEAQDLAPLQIALVEKWFGPCSDVHVFGDDDQTIYGFNGANPEWLRSLATAHSCDVLAQSHRVPRAAHEIAGRIIRRNHARVPKDYRPMAIEGAVLHLSTAKALALIDGRERTFVLARNRMFLRPFAQRLIDNRLPFFVEGGGVECPMAQAGAVAAVNVVAAVRNSTGDDPVDVADLASLLGMMASRGNPLLPDGIKSAVVELNGCVRPSELGLAALWARLRSDQHLDALTKIPPAHRAYFAALLQRFGQLPDPQIILTSIHGAKGLGAPLVILIPDMTKETHHRATAGTRAEVEAENRVFYVAVTRTERTLVLVDPTTRRHYKFPRVHTRSRGGAMTPTYPRGAAPPIHDIASVLAMQAGRRTSS
jgi:superfamily I DNA/RNA helicase